MGDKSPKPLVNFGDVVLIDLRDGVITGREPHTSQESNETLQCIRCMDASSITISLNPQIDRLWDTAELGITPHIQRKLDRQRIRCGDAVERG